MTVSLIDLLHHELDEFEAMDDLDEAEAVDDPVRGVVGQTDGGESGIEHDGLREDPRHQELAVRAAAEGRAEDIGEEEDEHQRLDRRADEECRDTFDGQ